MENFLFQLRPQLADVAVGVDAEGRPSMKSKIIKKLLIICLVLSFFTSQSIAHYKAKHPVSQGNLLIVTLCDGPDGVMLQ